MGIKQVEYIGKRIFVAVILLFFFGGAVTLYGKEITPQEKAGVPEIEELSPNWGASGMGFELTIQGKNLQHVQEIQFVPPIGIEVHNPPSINPKGTVATVNITIMGQAPLGPRMVTAVGPSGSSSAEPSFANIFKVTFAHIH